MKKNLNRSRFDRIMIMCLWPTFLAHVPVYARIGGGILRWACCRHLVRITVAISVATKSCGALYTSYEMILIVTWSRVVSVVQRRLAANRPLFRSRRRRRRRVPRCRCSHCKRPVTHCNPTRRRNEKRVDVEPLRRRRRDSSSAVRRSHRRRSRRAHVHETSG